MVWCIVSTYFLGFASGLWWYRRPSRLFRPHKELGDLLGCLATVGLFVLPNHRYLECVQRQQPDM